tara:strand:+ start:585 stop:878 length:294 start_codon:yes stop_codon:yes gene_type:complete
MITTLLLLIIFLIISKYLVDWIRYLKTGDSEEKDKNYWMFSYDYKSTKKEDFKPDDKDVLKKKRYRNKLIFLWYLNMIIIFLLINNFTSHILEKIVT